jgi:cyanobactin maturation PatA/PatG family protease
LRNSNLEVREGPAPAAPELGPACLHGTHIASIIFGRHDGPVPGIAPDCRGVLIPIFESIDSESFHSCSQLDLARALTAALLAGAAIINVSGGQFSPAGTAHPLLADVVRQCARQGVLIVAAAGNDGCACLHVPAALDSVLAVGAMDEYGAPLGFSNWGPAYQAQGILAPGKEIPGARAGGSGVAWSSGTSYATALVSGVSALLASLQLQRGERLNLRAVRDALLAAARDHHHHHAGFVRGGRSLAGPLDVRGALSFLLRSRHKMTEPNEVQASDLPITSRAADGVPSPPAPRIANLAQREDKQTDQSQEKPHTAPRPAEKAATCSCGAQAGGPQLVYALGQIGYDFPSEARLDSLVQKMAGDAGITGAPQRGLAFDQRCMLAHLDKNPPDAAAIEWTLSLEGTALYAIRPMGAFAAEGYRELRHFLKERLDEGVERISVPGLVQGKAALLNGQTVPVIVPELRGMYSWTTAALADAVAGPISADAPSAERDGHAQKREGVRNFLARVYHEVRNLGLLPQERALNYAATNAFEMGQIYAAAIKERMELDRVEVVPSPVARPGSDCWDVEVYFFYPERQVQTVRKVYRFTVDVSDTVPVTVGSMRQWFTR